MLDCNLSFIPAPPIIPGVPPACPPPQRSSRNTEKRRERSKVAARCRRGKESEIFSELSLSLPVSETSRANLDKASVMRLTLCDLKLKQMINNIDGFKQNSVKPSEKNEDDMFDALINSAVSGFVLVCSCDGDVIYVSEGIATCLGLSQYEVMGQSVLEFSHPCDHSDVKEMLLSSEKSPTIEPKSALFRMKSANSTRGRNVHHRSTNYKVVSCFGRIFSGDEGSSAEQSKKWFVGLCEPLLHPSDVDIPLNKQTFLSKHSPDMKFEYVDESIAEFMGYSTENMVGKSLFDFYHACDGDGIAKSFKSLYTKGQTVTERSRFLAKGGGWIWVVTQATSINNNAGKPTSVVCIHFVTSGVECEGEIVSHVQIRESNEPVIPIRKSIPVVPVTIPTPVPLPKKEPLPLQECTNLQKNIVASTPIVVAPAQEIPVAEPLVSSPFPGPLFSKPTPITAKIFAPRTDDMDTGFLMPVNDTLIVTKEEPEDLLHLAPIAGDECVPLTNVPLLDDLLQWLDAADMEYTVMEGYEDPLPLPLISVATGGALDTPIPIPMSMTPSAIVKDEANLDTMAGGSLNNCKSPLLMSSSDPTLISTTDPLLLSPFKTASPDPITASAASASPSCLDMMTPDLFSNYYSDNNAHNDGGGGLVGTAGASSHKSKAGGGYDDESFSGFPMVSDFQENLFSPGKCFEDVTPPESPPEQSINLLEGGVALNVNGLKMEGDGRQVPCSLFKSSSLGPLNKEPEPSSSQLHLKFAALGNIDLVREKSEPLPPEIASERPLPNKIAKASYTDERGNNKVWLQIESVTPPQPPWEVVVPTVSPPITQQLEPQKLKANSITTGTQTMIDFEKKLLDSEQKRLEERQRQLEQYRQLLMNPVVVQALLLNKKLRESTSTTPTPNPSRKRNFVGKLLGSGNNLLTGRSLSMTGGGGLLEMGNPLVELTDQDCEVNAPLNSKPLLDGPDILTALDTETVIGGGTECM